MSVKRALVWTSAVAASVVLSGCGSSSAPVSPAAVGQPPTTASLPSASSTPSPTVTAPADTATGATATTPSAASDGGADTAVLNDIATHLCAYAGAC